LLEANGREVIRQREGAELMGTLPLRADLEPIKPVGIYRNPTVDSHGNTTVQDVDAYELMAQARQYTEYSRVIMEFTDDFVPQHPAMWETVDQIILCGDRIVEDSQGLAVLRDWLFRGGKLCVFLDRTNPETIAAILGHGESYQVVDRVELDEFTIEDESGITGRQVKERRRFENPVELVRVVASDRTEVHCRVNGWPAAFWQQAGNGEVLFIALGPDGWRPAPIVPGWESLPENTDPEFRNDMAIRSIGFRFYRPRSVEPNVTDVIKPILQEQIGYQIPKRGLAGALLGLNGMALGVIGLWLAHRNQLDRLAVVLPVLAGVTSIVFLIIGSSNNRSVPSSVAYTQLVRYFPETSSAHVSGIAAIYQQTGKDLEVNSGRHGLLVPQIKPSDGTTHRLLWEDSDSGRWLNVSLPAGSVQFAGFDQGINLAETLVVRGHFDVPGFVGKISGSGQFDLQDALIASLPAPPTAIQPRQDGSFVAAPDDVFSTGQYLASSVVSDESRRRQDIYRSLLTKQDNSDFAVTPTLFVWGQPQPGVLSVPDDLVRQGSALAAIPLWIDRTPPASDFTIPATFVRIIPTEGQKGRSLSYNPRNGKWVTNSSRASNTRLRFELPRAVLPCRVTSADLTIKLNAPSRELHFHGVVNKRDVLIERIANPSGVYQINVTRPEWLSIDQRGGLEFTFEITQAEQELQKTDVTDSIPKKKESPPSKPMTEEEEKAATLASRPKSFTTWEIEYVRLNVRGTTL
jgi:hypothetical protein